MKMMKATAPTEVVGCIVCSGREAIMEIPDQRRPLGVKLMEPRMRNRKSWLRIVDAYMIGRTVSHDEVVEKRDKGSRCRLEAE
jgi:hypothetical protein